MNTSLTQALSLGGAAFLVGLSGAMSPGPYLTVTITRTLRDGWLAAALMLVGHALLEGALLIGFAFGLQTLLVKPLATTILSIVGGAVLLWMGAGLARGAWDGSVSADLEAEAESSSMAPVLHGAVVSISNPWWTLWWATIGVTLAAQGLAIGAVGVAAFFIGHQLADVVWYGFVITAVSKGRGLLSPTVYRGVIAALALFLAAFGLRFLLSAVAAIA